MKVRTPPITFWSSLEMDMHVMSERILALDGKNEKTKKAQKRNHFANLCNQKTVDLRTSTKTDFVQ